MKLAWRVVAIVAVVAAVASLGCGKGKQQTTSTPTVTSDVPLPEWAPKDPSPEFLRAARILAPMPEEILRDVAETGGPAWGAIRPLMQARWRYGWELVGSLSDSQILQLREAHTLRMPMKSLSARQRQLLDGYFEFAEQECAHRPSHPDGPLIVLYKLGAKENLSNVTIGFREPAGHHSVNLECWVVTGDGETAAFEDTIAVRRE